MAGLICDKIADYPAVTFTQHCSKITTAQHFGMLTMGVQEFTAILR